jgi:predicted MFS family arabinose efflux permease
MNNNHNWLIPIFAPMEKQGLTRPQLATMTVAAGICVANIYYNQPLLKDMARDLQVSERQIGLIPVLTQTGYALGLFFLTPLGDKMPRKRLISYLLILLILALAGMSLVPGIMAIYLMCLLTGASAVIAQVILPMAAGMDPDNKGKNVGIIFTGILTGILAARVFSGYVATWLNWRWVYAISAVMVLVAGIFLQAVLPEVRQTFQGTYVQLLGSTLQQIGRFALLRRTALLGALVFGIFCSFWTTLTFHLGGPPFNYATDIIGLFGLLAIGGALLAPVFGRLADKRHPARSLVMTIGLILSGVLLVLAFPNDLWATMAAVVLLDIGVQATQVSNVATIYTLDAAAHSRINTVYMTAYFLGGSIGTFVGVQCWHAGGWHIVCWQLLLWGVVALALALESWRKLATLTA